MRAAMNRACEQMHVDDERSREGAVETFITQFNRFESSAGVFARCRDADGLAWWDLVRYSIQFAICAERGIYAHAQRETPAFAARARSFARQMALLVRDALKVAFLPPKDIQGLYVSGRRSPPLLQEVERAPQRCLVVADGSAPAARHWAIHKNSIDFFVRLASRMVRTPEAINQESARLDEEIRAAFSTSVDVGRIIRTKYAQHRASRLAWRFVLSRLRAAKIVGLVNDDTLRTLVWLANERGLVTREFQHGYMGSSHVNYSYPPLPAPLATLPREAVVHRDSGDITYPVSLCRQDAAVGGTTAPGSPARDIDVLVGGSPTRSAEAIAILQALVDRGLVLAVKLHPSQSASSSGILDRFTQTQVHTYASESDFVGLARRARVYVPANPTSTTSFEAVENGARLVVVDYDGVKLTSVLDGIVTSRVSSCEELHEAILPHLQPSQDALLC